VSIPVARLAVDAIGQCRSDERIDDDHGAARHPVSGSSEYRVLTPAAMHAANNRVEVSHTTLHDDRTKKRAIYAAHAIPEYWIVNLVDEQLEVHCDPVDGDDAHVSIYLRDSMVGPLIDHTYLNIVVDCCHSVRDE